MNAHQTLQVRRDAKAQQLSRRQELYDASLEQVPQLRDLEKTLYPPNDSARATPPQPGAVPEDPRDLKSERTKYGSKREAWKATKQNLKDTWHGEDHGQYTAIVNELALVHGAEPANCAGMNPELHTVLVGFVKLLRIIQAKILVRNLARAFCTTHTQQSSMAGRGALLRSRAAAHAAGSTLEEMNVQLAARGGAQPPKQATTKLQAARELALLDVKSHEETKAAQAAARLTKYTNMSTKEREDVVRKKVAWTGTPPWARLASPNDHYKEEDLKNLMQEYGRTLSQAPVERTAREERLAACQRQTEGNASLLRALRSSKYGAQLDAEDNICCKPEVWTELCAAIQAWSQTPEGSVVVSHFLHSQALEPLPLCVLLLNLAVQVQFFMKVHVGDIFHELSPSNYFNLALGSMFNAMSTRIRNEEQYRTFLAVPANGAAMNEHIRSICAVADTPEFRRQFEPMYQALIFKTLGVKTGPAAAALLSSLGPVPPPPPKSAA